MLNIEDKDFIRKHRTEWQDFLWIRFLDKLSGSLPKKDRDAISTLFSNYEKRLITRRIAALALIRQGLGAREIGRLLWLSRSTISALKKDFFNKAKDHKGQRFYRGTPKTTSTSIQSTSRSWIEEMFNGIDIWELIKNPPRPAGLGIKDSGLPRKTTKK